MTILNFWCIILNLKNGPLCVYVYRYIGNLDLCGQQIHKPCKTSLGFPAVLPHAESDEAAGKLFIKKTIFL